MGYGPKLLEYDLKNNKYRMDEYIDNSRELFYNEIFEENILKNLIILVNKYSQICNIYKFELFTENKNTNNNSIKLLKEGNKKFEINYNIYDNIINNIYPKAKNIFEKFNKDYMKSSFKENENLNEKYINKIKNLLNDFRKIFCSFLNKKGFFCLNHNDIYNVNILLNKFDNNKLYLIDNEFASLNLIGFDVAFYLVMSLFQYYPKYEYFPGRLNYEKFNEIFKQYLDIFISTNFDWINKDNERKLYIEKIKKKNILWNCYVLLIYFALL